MVRRIDQIETDLIALEEAIGAIATDLEAAYESYLDDLAAVASQQLILAAYHLCTQGYPEQFLELSASQREETQQALRSLTQEVTQQLREVLSPKPSEPDPETPAEPVEPLTSAVILEAQGMMHEEAAIALPPTATEGEEAGAEQVLSQLPEPNLDATVRLPAEPLSVEQLPEEAISSDDGAIEVTQTDNNTDVTEAIDDSSGEDLPLVARSKSIVDTEGTVILQLGDLAEDDDDDEENALSVLPSDPLNRVVKWHERIEDRLAMLLQKLSYEANRLMHRAKVLPHHLPDAVMEVAIKSGMTAESAGSPNLMKLMIEAKSEERDESGVLQFVIIRLRLSELEFGNAGLASQRSQMRQLLSRLNKVGKDYRKRQREKSVAQAELAWRSTWHEG
ncbi:MAG: hypothetical protein AAFY26_21020 [Cyanobacteria bacterium J06638_22]